MNPKRRNQLIDKYFAAMDEERYDLFDAVLAEDITYQMEGNEMQGVEAVRSFFEDAGVMSDTTHDAPRRVHGDGVTVCEGRYSAHVAGQGDIEGPFVDVIEFDKPAERISRVSIYTR